MSYPDGLREALEQALLEVEEDLGGARVTVTNADFGKDTWVLAGETGPS